MPAEFETPGLRQTSQRQAFCDAWKALKSVFVQGSAPDTTEELTTFPQTP